MEGLVERDGAGLSVIICGESVAIPRNLAYALNVRPGDVISVTPAKRFERGTGVVTSSRDSQNRENRGFYVFAAVTNTDIRLPDKDESVFVEAK